MRSTHFFIRILTGVSCALAGLVLWSAPAFSADPLRWDNPLVKQRADPSIYLHTDGYYYFTGSVPAYDSIELRRAKTLGELGTAEAKTVWYKHSIGEMGAHIWAPEIHFIDGRWYIYFAAGRAEKVWDIRIYVLENTSPNPLEGQWKECGQLKTNWESFSLDATTFECRGVRYLCWAQNNPNFKSNTSLYLAKMDGPTTITGAQTEISRPDQPWEQIGFRVNEGPAALIHGNRIFISYSASKTDAHYCLGLLSADVNSDLLDPKSWTKSPGPVLVSDSRSSQFGPGHNCFTTSPDGKTDILVYHARNYEQIVGDPLYDPNRNTRAQVIRWTASGQPDFGTPVPDGSYGAPP